MTWFVDQEGYGDGKPKEVITLRLVSPSYLFKWHLNKMAPATGYDVWSWARRVELVHTIHVSYMIFAWPLELSG
jgi:hypothetical protein